MLSLKQLAIDRYAGYSLSVHAVDGARRYLTGLQEDYALLCNQ
jgi:hypothetical protein